MDNEMIERVGAAIETYIERLSDARNYGGFINEIAIKAIKAMREPTEAMLAAYGEFGTLDVDAYQVMIDAVIND